ncbi:hypothetical protein PCANC_09817 [Puccinia coronata f. sp. avenae]|uniref:Ubiquitin-like domain-containing protein n=1 Tax=Puccinia coronata f. sp. avenae TaxID=200324 RepID=A0A2N5T0Q0_9BASI|nr:hypothetical protein PCANC_09817 [Puccinia coronata f. sp. avenae]
MNRPDNVHHVVDTCPLLLHRRLQQPCRLQLSSKREEPPLTIKAKRTTPFVKIYNALAQEKGVSPDSFRLYYDGEKLPRNETTPDDLGFGDEEVLDHFLEHIDGSSGPEAANAGKRREGHAAVNSSREMT